MKILISILFAFAALAFHPQTLNVSSAATSYLTGTTGSIGGGLLAVGASATGTATVTGALVTHACTAQPSDGTNIATSGAVPVCTVTSSNTVTVNVMAVIAVTPAAKTYTVKVFP